MEYIKLNALTVTNFIFAQTKKRLKERYIQHHNSYLKPDIYKSNLATHSIKNKHTFPNLNNISLLKHISKGPKMTLWENLEKFKHKTSNKLMPEQIPVSYTHLDVYKRQVKICHTINCKI